MMPHLEGDLLSIVGRKQSYHTASEETREGCAPVDMLLTVRSQQKPGLWHTYNIHA